ncbi:MAG: hypothetical protein ONB46_18230, partial [candidate division KSB1 bacterium]|nr:hypothetical protein [candidate division KSB1 bacterium]
GSQQEFTNWLTTMYLFYLINRIVDFDEGIKLLPEIHRRTSQAAGGLRTGTKGSKLPAKHHQFPAPVVQQPVF